MIIPNSANKTYGISNNNILVINSKEYDQLYIINITF